MAKLVLCRVAKLSKIKQMWHLQMICSKFAIEVNPFFRPVLLALNETVHKLSPSYLQKPAYGAMPLEPAETRPRSNFPESRVAFPRYNQLRQTPTKQC